MRTAYLIIGGLLILAIALITFVPSIGTMIMPQQAPHVTQDGIEWPVKKSVRFYIPSENMGQNELAPPTDGPDAKTRCGTASQCSDPMLLR